MAPGFDSNAHSAAVDQACGERLAVFAESLVWRFETMEVEWFARYGRFRRIGENGCWRCGAFVAMFLEHH